MNDRGVYENDMTPQIFGVKDDELIDDEDGDDDPNTNVPNANPTAASHVNPPTKVPGESVVANLSSTQAANVFGKEMATASLKKEFQ